MDPVEERLIFIALKMLQYPPPVVGARDSGHHPHTARIPTVGNRPVQWVRALEQDTAALFLNSYITPTTAQPFRQHSRS